jgi:hypothetical protein
MKEKLLQIFIFITTSSLLAGCSYQQIESSEVVVVKVPPQSLLIKITDNPHLEDDYWKRRKFLFPQTKIPDPLPKGIPNDDSLLTVTLENNGKIKINLSTIADLSNVQPLQAELEKIFRYREQYKVFEPNGEKTLKITSVRAGLSSKYKDVIKVIQAVELSGADPIILEIDDLPE